MRTLTTSGMKKLSPCFGLELPVDQHGGLGAFRGGHDDKLYVEGRIADDEDTGHAGLPVAIGPDGALARELAPEACGERVLWPLPGGEEQRIARHAVAVAQPERLQPPVHVIERRDGLIVHDDPARIESLAHGGCQTRRPVREQPDVGAPGEQRQRERRARASRAEHRDSSVAPLPPVAVRTMMHAHAVALGEAIDRRQIVAHARGDEQLAPLQPLAARERHIEAGVAARDGHDALRPPLDAVAADLLAPAPEELGRRYTVA
jgi:hypothetical protein